MGPIRARPANGHNRGMRLVSARRPPLVPSELPTLLVLLHGLAADENDLLGLADELDAGLDVISLRAPRETGYGGYSWFDIRFCSDGTREMDEAQAVESRDLIVDEIEKYRRDLQPAKVVLGGFSQGAMISAGVLLERSDLIDAAWLMSGRHLPIFVPKPSPAAKTVLIQHGLFDDVVPVEEGRELEQIVAASGHWVQMIEYPMAHQIGYESLLDAKRWLWKTIENRSEE